MLASANRKLFTGHEYDPNTGLYYAKARYYDPDQGRFLTQDSYLGEPGVPPSLHRYLYVASNPTRYRDPTGHVYVDESGETVNTPEGAGLSSDYLEWSSADFEMADSELKYFCTTGGGGRECGIWTPGSGGGKQETAESRTGERAVALSRPSEEVSEVEAHAQPGRRRSARTLLQQAAAESSPRELTSTRAERSGAFWEGTLDWVPGVVKNVFDSGAFAMDLVAPKWEERDGILQRTKGRGLGWHTADFARDSLRGWSSSWEREWMFGRPDDPLLALSYDDGMRGMDAVSTVAPVGGAGVLGAPRWFGRGARSGAGLRGASAMPPAAKRGGRFHSGELGKRVNTGAGVLEDGRPVALNNCPFCTAGGQSSPRLTSSEVSRITGVREGPLSPSAIGPMFEKIGLGDGTFVSANSLKEVRSIMRASPKGTRFGVGFYYPKGGGHIVAGRNGLLGPYFRDFQGSGLPGFRPQGSGGSKQFFVWRLDK